jgi:hypothetical protein
VRCSATAVEVTIAIAAVTEAVVIAAVVATVKAAKYLEPMRWTPITEAESLATTTATMHGHLPTRSFRLWYR